jgi:carbon monoxide dehydrogenase subunit G
MLTLKSQEFTLAAQAEQVIAFLSETKNYALLLPENQTSGFQCSPTQFSFKAAGQIELTLEKQLVETNLLHFKGAKSNPFAFDLYVRIQAEQNTTKGYIEIKADLNMMLKMLVEKPLQKLLTEMASNLATQLSAGK